MPHTLPMPVLRVHQALDSLSYWTPPPPPRRAPPVPVLSPVEVMYAYWRAV